MDSLKGLLDTSKPDSNKVKLLNTLSYESYKIGNFEDEMTYAREALSISRKINWETGIAQSYINIGASFDDFGKYNEAIEHYQKAITVFKSIDKKDGTGKSIAVQKGLASCYNNIGLVYNNLANYPEALKYFFDALKIREKINDKSGAASALNNIGMIYERQGKTDLALEKYYASLKIKEEIGDKYNIAATYNNIGIIYTSQKKYDLALEKHFSALKIREETGDKRGMADSYNNIGNTYYRQENYSEALKYHLLAKEVRKEINDRSGYANACMNLGKDYFKLNKLHESKSLLEEGLKLALETGFKDWIKNGYLELYKTESALGNYKKALEHYELFIAYRDSIYNEENERKSLETAINYEFEKKEAKLKAEREKKEAIEKAEQAKKDEINREEKKRQRIVILLVSCVLIVALIFSIFIFRNLKITRKQKLIIEEQKQIVEEKHKEITDSINYAERIQRSFLATDLMLNKNLKDYFVLFQPKESVSGDFYWAAELNNGNFLLACADSTGHGVPGAIMSILNISSLEKAIEKEINPDAILNETRKLIIERLKNDGSIEGGKDGMDCSLVSFDFTNMFIHFSLANNPLWIIREKELIEFKPDKMPVGKHERQNISFKLHQFKAKKDDLIFLFTDGYADQFGGPKGKKFKYSNLQQLILEKSGLPANSIKLELKKKLNEWKGDLEQVDDVCIIGIKL